MNTQTYRESFKFIKMLYYDVIFKLLVFKEKSIAFRKRISNMAL